MANKKILVEDIKQGDANEQVFRPVNVAALLSLAYLVLCSLYIWLSGLIAAGVSESIDELELIELIKGLSFVFSTGIFFFGFAWYLLRRIARNEKELIKHRDALIISERRAIAGVFAASVAHDINNVLGAFHAGVDLLKESSDLDSTGRQLVKYMKQAADRITAMLKRLRLSEKEGLPGQLENADLGVVFRESVELARTHMRVRGCTFSVEAPQALMAVANPAIIDEMIINLVLNAADATEGTGTIEMLVKAEEEHIVFEVHDNGPGIPKEKRKSIFDAFYTTKKKGSGFGLLSVKACAGVHRGKVEVAESHLGGACFRVTIPAKEKPVEDI